MANVERYEKLVEVLPSRPEVWTSDDVDSWLEIIGMEKYKEQFRKLSTYLVGEMAVDGLLILELTEEDLKTEMNVSIKLHRRKIVKGNHLK